MNFKELKKIDTRLNKISKKLSFTVINPINADAERGKFFSKKDYHPCFKYARYRANLDLLKKKLEELKTENSVFGQILEEKRLRHLKRVLMLKNLGKEEFTACSVDLFGKPSQELVEKAKNMLTIETKKAEETLTTDEVMSFLKSALDEYELKDWKIYEKEMAAMAAVRPHNKYLYIKKDALFSKSFLDRLIIHEVGTHVLRAENGSRQPFKLFLTGLPNYMLTEEGLAVVNEELNGHLNKETLRNYVGRVISVDLGLKGSFNEVYTELSKWFIAESAFKLALRAKRGISDTSKPGGLTKDYLYLDGYFKVKEFQAKGGKIKDLYYGKIGIEHVPLLKKIPRLKKPGILPKF